MKRTLLLIMLSAIMASCVTEEPLDEKVEIRTDPSIAFFNVSKEESRETKFGAHRLLGYGYDATGEYIRSTI